MEYIPRGQVAPPMSAKPPQGKCRATAEVRRYAAPTLEQKIHTKSRTAYACEFECLTPCDANRRITFHQSPVEPRVAVGASQTEGRGPIEAQCRPKRRDFEARRSLGVA